MLSHRDEQRQESDRLERQNELLKHVFSGRLLHPSIAIGEHFAAADIGTGSGAWLNDLARSLPKPAVGRSGRLVGFDISSAKFPAVNEGGVVELVVHDIRERFPARYRGVFDVVHLRLLVYALCEGDVGRVVENVAELLRQLRAAIPIFFIFEMMPFWLDFDALGVGLTRLVFLTFFFP